MSDQHGVRGTGRTTKMLRELGEGRSIVIVPTTPMREHVLHIVRRLNVEDGGSRNVVVKVIPCYSDAESLRGISCPIVADHAFWELTDPRTAALVSEIIVRTNARL